MLNQRGKRTNVPARECCPSSGSGHNAQYHRINLSIDAMLLVKTQLEWILSNGSHQSRREVVRAVLAELQQHLDVVYPPLPRVTERPMKRQRRKAS